jgi:hypothetical protein
MTEYAQPIYATPRRHDRPTNGARVARVSKLLGTPFMPWQGDAADVFGEMVETPAGLWVPAYREAIVTVMRQEGKTTFVLAEEIDRALNYGEPQRIAYTAQTGLDARKKLLEDQVPLIARSKLAPIIDEANGGKIRRKNGEEGLNFVGGSILDVISSGEAAGHGRTLDLGIIDEAFDDTDDRREQAMVPAMATRRLAQLIVASTMGTDKSTYLNRKVDAGRDAALAADPNSRIAYIEYAVPLEEDIDDARIWAKYMPAYGITIDESVVRHARQTMSEGEFRRAFCNQRTASDERVIPIDVWAAVQHDVTPDGKVMFAIDANPERTSASIGVSDAEGRCELVAHERGTGWLVNHAAALARKWGAKVAYDPAGPAAVFAEDLEREGVRTVKVGGRDFANACAFFFDGCVDKTLQIRPHQALNDAVAAAARRVSGDTWTWGRRDLAVDISPIVAVTIASWAMRYASGGPVFFY